VEEKLFMKCWKKWLNVTSRQKRGLKQKNSCLRSRTQMCGLADLASGFVLSFYMRVGRDLGDEHHKQQY
jgi:hypothetical protein